MNKQTAKAIEKTNIELAKVSNTIGDFHALLSNHITDYAHQFELLNHSVRTFKLWLILITTLVIVALGGFVTMAVVLLIKLLEG